MNFFALLFAIFLIFGLTTADDEWIDANGKCKKVGTYKVDCNRCFCGEVGRGAGCTLMLCFTRKDVPKTTEKSV